MKTATHPTGIKLTFNEEKHQYIDENNKTYYSVTKVIHSLFPRFEAEKIAGFVARKKGVTRDIVLKEWEDKRSSSASFGTKIHLYAESLLRKEKWDVKDNTERELKFMNQLDQLIPKLLTYYDLVSPELIIFSPEYSISGTLDLLMRNKRTGKLAIFDWKTNEEIRSINKHKAEQSGLYQLNHIPDCNFFHYAIQLNVYRSILINEKYYKDSDFELSIFHIQENRVVPYILPLLEAEATYVMETAKNPIDELKIEYDKDNNKEE